MRLLDRVVTDLTNNKKTIIETPKTTFTGVLNTKFEDSWDFFMHDNTTPVGYAVVVKSRRVYNLMNQTDVLYRHEGMVEGFGWGIEVNDTYRNRNIGHALLSVVIRLAQIDFLQEITTKIYLITFFNYSVFQ